jgi:hypothetical protein
LKVNGGVVSLTPTMILPRALTSSSLSAAAGTTSVSSMADTVAVTAAIEHCMVVPSHCLGRVSYPAWSKQHKIAVGGRVSPETSMGQEL